MRTRTVILALSLAANALCAAFFVYARLSRPGRALFYEAPGDWEGERVTGAAIATVPAGADLVFGPVSFALEAGEEALLQYSYAAGGRQANWVIAALYDRSVVDVSPTAFGMRIRALAAGETALQMISADGIRDVARVRVTESHARPGTDE